MAFPPLKLSEGSYAHCGKARYHSTVTISRFVNTLVGFSLNICSPHLMRFWTEGDKDELVATLQAPTFT